MSPQLPLRPLGFHLWDWFLFSLVTPVQLSLPMPTVHGWSTHTGLGNPLLTPPCHPSAMCGLMAPGGQGEQREQQSCSLIKGHTYLTRD